MIVFAVALIWLASANCCVLGERAVLTWTAVLAELGHAMPPETRDCAR